MTQTLAHLGPPIPPAWKDPPPFVIHSYEVLSELNGLGEAIVRMQVTLRDEARQLGPQVRLIIAINPRRMQIIRIRGEVAAPAGGTETIWLYPESLPGLVIDLTVTLAYEQFSSLMVRR
jgi:hypothetical protein